MTTWQFQLTQIKSQCEFEYVRNLYPGCPSEFFLEMGCLFRFVFLSPFIVLLFHIHLSGWFGINCANSRQDYTTSKIYKEETILSSNCFFLPKTRQESDRSRRQPEGSFFFSFYRNLRYQPQLTAGGGGRHSSPVACTTCPQ